VVCHLGARAAGVDCYVSAGALEASIAPRSGPHTHGRVDGKTLTKFVQGPQSNALSRKLA